MARILVADDDAMTLDILSAALAGAGHDALCAYNGHEAYEMALSEQPDMVFLAVSLPVFDGCETCKMLREDPEISPALPIVFLTTPDDDRRAMQNAGATDEMPKDAELHTVQDMLVRHLPPEALPGPAD